MEYDHRDLPNLPKENPAKPLVTPEEIDRMFSKFWTTREVALLFDVDPRVIRRAIHARELRGVRIGLREWRVQGYAILEFIKKKRENDGLGR